MCSLGVRYDVADLTIGTSSSFENGGGVYDASKDLAIAGRLRRRRPSTRGGVRALASSTMSFPRSAFTAATRRSFGQNNGFTADRQPLGPQRGLQWEVGLKAEPLPGLSATLAFFQITKSGVPTRDLRHWRSAAEACRIAAQPRHRARRNRAGYRSHDHRRQLRIHRREGDRRQSGK